MAGSAGDREAIEREMEETRERLASTIDQLVHRTHPKTIASRQAASIKGYFVDAGTGAARADNILKVVGTLAGVVVVFTIVRKVVR